MKFGTQTHTTSPKICPKPKMLFITRSKRDYYKGETTSTIKSWGRKYLLKAAEIHILVKDMGNAYVCLKVIYAEATVASTQTKN